MSGGLPPGTLDGMAASTWPDRDVGRSFAVGAIGELTLAAAIDTLAAHGVPALHDRRGPEVESTIDHLVVTAAGVWVVHTELRRGTVTWRHARSPSGHQLMVRGRNRQDLLVELDSQVREVGRALLEHDLAEVPVRGAVCFVGGNVPVLQRQLDLGGRLVTWPCAFGKRLALEGPMDGDARTYVLKVLDAAFPPAPTYS
jgi:hypothetical protein